MQPNILVILKIVQFDIAINNIKKINLVIEFPTLKILSINIKFNKKGRLVQCI